MLNKTHIILLFLLSIGCYQKSIASSKVSGMELIFENESMSYCDNIREIRALYNDDINRNLSNDEIKNLYNDDFNRNLYTEYLKSFPTHFGLSGFYKDSIDGKYIQLSIIDESEAVERLRGIDNKDEKNRFIHDSLITLIKLFPQKIKLNYSYNDILELKYLSCEGEGKEYPLYYDESESIAKSKYIKTLSENKQIVLNSKFVLESFSVPDMDVYLLDNIEFLIQNFDENKWISSDTLLIENFNFFLDCLQVIEYKHDDHVLILLSGGNVGLINYKYEYLIKINFNSDKFGQYELYKSESSYL